VLEHILESGVFLLQPREGLVQPGSDTLVELIAEKGPPRADGTKNVSV
jgi:hypothetical protein